MRGARLRHFSIASWCECEARHSLNAHTVELYILGSRSLEDPVHADVMYKVSRNSKCISREKDGYVSMYIHRWKQPDGRERIDFCRDKREVNSRALTDERLLLTQAKRPRGIFVTFNVTREVNAENCEENNLQLS